MSKINSLTNWPIIFVAYLTLFTLGLLDNTRGPYFPDITLDLGLSDTKASLFFVVASSMAFFSGRVVPALAQKIGVVNVLRLGQILMGVGFGLIAFSNSLSILILTCAIFGYGFGLINVVQNLLILHGSSGALRRRLLSGLHGMYAFAALISPLLVAYLFQFNISWREAFVGFALFVVVCFVSTFFVESQSIKLEKNHSGGRLKMRSYLLVAAILSFYVISEVILVTRISLYVRRVFHYSPEQASILLALFFLCLLAGRFLFLFIPFKAKNLKIIEISLVSSMIVFILGLYIHPWLLALCGLTMAPVFALSVDLIADIFTEQSAEAISSSLALSCVFIVSMHFIVGLLSDWYGIQLAMNLGVFSLLISWFLLQWMKRKDLGQDLRRIAS